MKTNLCQSGIALLTAALLVSVTNVFAVEYFSDNFDGTAIDGSKWEALAAPPRFYQDAGNYNPSGYWTTPTGNPSYGSVSLNNSWVSLYSNNSTVYPYVESIINPFPQTGDFVLNLKMRFDRVTPYGTGFCVKYSDSDNPLTNSIFSIWQDSSTTTYLTAGLFGSVPHAPDFAWQGVSSDTSEHIYTLEYIGGNYSILIDGIQRIGPIANSMRPNQIWFGNPAWSWWTPPGNWTNFSIDYLTVTPEPATLLLLGLGSFVLRRRK
jgi:hypothetical protein